MIPQQYITELYKEILKKKLNKDEISKLKIKLCKKYKLREMPTDIELFLSNSDPKLKNMLKSKPVRSISGVAPIAIMTKPSKCPHGKCAMCPGGIKSEFGDVPQSYTGKEPASMRGKRANWDPYIQVFNRLEQYIVMGHTPEKADIIIMGGTVLSRGSYLENFVKYAFKAMNDFSRIFYKKGEFQLEKFKKFFEMPGKVDSPERIERIHARLRKLKTDKQTTLESEKKKNEKSNIRCIGLTIETRPDWGFKEHGKRMLKLGCTRVELGIQSTYDEQLLRIKRGHTVSDNIMSIRELKDLGFKLNFHYMPGLPGMDYSKEIAGFKELFENPDYKPDMLKIYPCMVMPGTKLYEEYKKGKYVPLTTQKASELIAEFKRYIPRYCRVMRVQRDIPSSRITAGVDKTNLRQYVDKILKEKGIKCNCIRCREIRGETPKGIIYCVLEYPASCGKEYFIEAKTKDDKLLGYCRLRFPSKSIIKEITADTSIVRELHVYGTALSLKSTKSKKTSQHRGIGKKLMEMAEGISRKNRKTKIAVISGVGVKEYYKKLGYKKEGEYMTKMLR